jgi:hypothetical protein
MAMALVNQTARQFTDRLVQMLKKRQTRLGGNPPQALLDLEAKNGDSAFADPTFRALAGALLQQLPPPPPLVSCMYTVNGQTFCINNVGEAECAGDLQGTPGPLNGCPAGVPSWF